MAVTITSNPNNYTPSGNPFTWTFDSDQTAQPNFYFLVEVYVNGVLKARETRFPDNSNNARFDASGYAERFCNAPNLTTDFAANANNNVDMNLKIIERYGDPVADGATVTSPTRRVFKSKLTKEDWIAYNPTNYILGTDTKFLSLQDNNTRKIAEGEKLRLMVIDDLNGQDIEFSLFDSSDSLVVKATQVYTSNRITIFNVGIADIIAGTTITQANFDSAAYYTIKVNGTTAEVTEEVKVTIDRDCRRESHKRLHFLSTIGSIESFTYELYSTERGSIETKKYEREFGEWDGTDFIYTLNTGTTIDYQKIARSELLVRSDWLTEAEQRFLEKELGFSPLVLMEDDLDPVLGLRRVALNKRGYALKRTKQDVKFKEEILLDLGRFTSTGI